MSKKKIRILCKCRCHKDIDGDHSYCVNCLDRKCKVYLYLKTFYKNTVTTLTSNCYLCSKNKLKRYTPGICWECAKDWENKAELKKELHGLEDKKRIDFWKFIIFY